MKKFVFCIFMASAVEALAADRYALVDDAGVVTNVIVIEDGAEYTPPKALKLVKDTGKAAPGGTYSAVFGFSEPPMPAAAVPLAAIDPAKKLKEFLARNPDVAKMLAE